MCWLRPFLKTSVNLNQVAVLLIAATFVLRALIPAGFMPQVSRGDSFPALELCLSGQVWSIGNGSAARQSSTQGSSSLDTKAYLLIEPSAFTLSESLPDTPEAHTTLACVFSLFASLYIPLALTAMVSVWTSSPILAKRSQGAFPAVLRSAGPPLGPRAPPAQIAG